MRVTLAYFTFGPLLKSHSSSVFIRGSRASLMRRVSDVLRWFKTLHFKMKESELAPLGGLQPDMLHARNP